MKKKKKIIKSSFSLAGRSQRNIFLQWMEQNYLNKLEITNWDHLSTMEWIRNRKQASEYIIRSLVLGLPGEHFEKCLWPQQKLILVSTFYFPFLSTDTFFWVRLLFIYLFIYLFFNQKNTSYDQ